MSSCSLLCLKPKRKQMTKSKRTFFQCEILQQSTRKKQQEKRLLLGKGPFYHIFLHLYLLQGDFSMFFKLFSTWVLRFFVLGFGFLTYDHFMYFMWWRFHQVSGKGIGM